MKGMILGHKNRLNSTYVTPILTIIPSLVRGICNLKLLMKYKKFLLLLKQVSIEGHLQLLPP